MEATDTPRVTNRCFPVVVFRERVAGAATTLATRTIIIGANIKNGLRRMVIENELQTSGSWLIFELPALVLTCHEAVPLLFFFLSSLSLFFFFFSFNAGRYRACSSTINTCFHFFFLPAAGQSSPRYRSDTRAKIGRGYSLEATPRHDSIRLDSTRLDSTPLVPALI